MNVHILKNGWSRCGGKLTPAGPPYKGNHPVLPDGDRWVSFDDKDLITHATCWRCICVHLGKPIPTPPPSPEHDKVAASNDLPQKLCEFVLEFLADKNLVLAERHRHTRGCWDEHDELACGCRDGELYTTGKNVVDLAAAFIGVDAKKYSLEKDAMLKHIRGLNALEHWAKTEGRVMLAQGR